MEIRAGRCKHPEEGRDLSVAGQVGVGGRNVRVLQGPGAFQLLSVWDLRQDLTFIPIE